MHPSLWLPDLPVASVARNWWFPASYRLLDSKRTWVSLAGNNLLVLSDLNIFGRCSVAWRLDRAMLRSVRSWIHCFWPLSLSPLKESTLEFHFESPLFWVLKGREYGCREEYSHNGAIISFEGWHLNKWENLRFKRVQIATGSPWHLKSCTDFPSLLPKTE